MTTESTGKYSHAEGIGSVASEETAHAEGMFTVASGKYSHAEGGIDTTASGQSSHAEGFKTQANGSYSHAEGNQTKADGEESHAEGYLTKANGNNSHAEGSNTQATNASAHAEGDTTKANGVASHAEGMLTVANGLYSHAEGMLTVANSSYSHAENQSTKANGINSHAEGYLTTASHRSQHVFGEGNIVDPSENSATARGTYVEIVGNGSVSFGKVDVASNARTLDWNGNETLAGKLTLGAAPTENMDAATKKYVDDAVAAGGGGGTSGGDADTVNGHTVNSDVPANAEFTDTTYTFAGGTNSFTVTPEGGTAQTVNITINNVDADTVNGHSVNADVPANAKFTDENTTYTFTGGTNSFTVTPSGGSPQVVNITTSGGSGGDAATVNGHTVESDVPANAKFTDENTTYTFAGGTNKIIITPSGGSAQDVTITPTKVANAYSSSSTYDVGDITEKDGQLYKCNADIDTPEAWDSTKWDPVVIADEITGLNSDSFFESGTGYNSIKTKNSGTTSSSDYSFAIGGGTTASGRYAVSEGIMTVASGNYSHAEGSQTTASGEKSHSEGEYTSASGYASHVEGVGGIASGTVQHVSGRYNIEDTNDTYAEIIGNGTSLVRSNARTLDWNGNEILAGKLTVGTAPTANMDVATKQYVDTALTNNISGSGTSGYLTKFNGTNTVTNGPAFGNSTQTFLRNDGVWAVPTAGGEVVSNYSFENGVNSFTVTPAGGSPQVVNVTPSITNNITGSGTTGSIPKFSGANTLTDGIALGNSTTTFLRNDGTWTTPSADGGDAATVNNHTVESNVPANAKFTDNNTTYTFEGGTNSFTVTPSGGTAQKVDITIDGVDADTVNGHSVNADVPAGAVFTDNNTTYTFTGGTNSFTVTPSNGSPQTVNITTSGGSGGDAATVNGHTVDSDVPANAVFSDTTYTFTSGTNGFTVTPSNGEAQNITVTPSVSTVAYNANGLMTAAQYRKIFNRSEEDGSLLVANANKFYTTGSDGNPSWRVTPIVANDQDGLMAAAHFRQIFNKTSATDSSTDANNAGKVWKCNSTGLPGWRDDTDTTYDAVTYNANGLCRADTYRRVHNISSTTGEQRTDNPYYFYSTDANGAPSWRNNITVNADRAGLMSSAMYTKLSGIDAGATVSGVTSISAGSKSVATGWNTSSPVTLTSYKATTAGTYLVMLSATCTDSATTGSLGAVVNTVNTGMGAAPSVSAFGGNGASAVSFYAYTISSATTFYALAIQSTGSAKTIHYNFGVFRLA